MGNNKGRTAFAGMSSGEIRACEFKKFQESKPSQLPMVARGIQVDKKVGFRLAIGSVCVCSTKFNAIFLIEISKKWKHKRIDFLTGSGRKIYGYGIFQWVENQSINH